MEQETRETPPKKKTNALKAQIDSKTVTLEEFERMRKKYFKFTGEGKNKHAFCQVSTKTPDGNEVQCGKKYSNVSTDTCNKHLCKHVHLPEFSGKKLIQGNLDEYMKKFSGVENEFKTLALSLVVNNNLSWSVLDSNEWRSIVYLHLKQDPFGSHAAKNLMMEFNEKGRKSLLDITSTFPYFSISEDEGTVHGNTKVLHNLHTCGPDLSVETYFLRYFDTVNKEGVTLIEHWDKTYETFKIPKEKVVGFQVTRRCIMFRLDWDFCMFHVLRISLI
jgi:hypothetical protein